MPRVPLNNSPNLPPARLTGKPAGTKIGKKNKLLSYSHAHQNISWKWAPKINISIH